MARLRSPHVSLLLITSLGTIALLVALWSGTPTVQALWGWFWPLHASKLSAGATVGVALFSVIAFACAIRLVTATPTERSRRVAVGALIVLGFVHHQVLALAAGRGLDEMRDRAMYTGHAEFAATASRDIDVWHMVTEYETFVREPGQRYSRSKPPGQLLFYCAAAAVADRIMPVLFDPPPPDTPRILGRRHFRLLNFATLFFPFIALLVLLPLTILGRCFLGSLRATWPAFLYLLAPGPALIQLHLDQVLYPLLSVSYWALIAVAATRSRRSTQLARPSRSWPWWASAGLVAWISLFVTFSLLPALLVGLGVALALTEERSARERWRRVLHGSLVSGAAILVASVVAYVVIHYDPIAAYSRAMVHHVRWKAWDESFRWPAALLNVIEAGYWLGLPLTVFFLYQATTGWRRVLRSPPTVAALATVAAIILSAILGKTVGEVARLWLFLTPMFALGAAAGIMRVRIASARARLTLVALLQLAWMLGIKAFQDFY